MVKKYNISSNVATVLGFIWGFQFLNNFLEKLMMSFVTGELTEVQVNAYNSIIKYYLPVLAGLIALLMWVLVTCARMDFREHGINTNSRKQS